MENAGTQTAVTLTENPTKLYPSRPHQAYVSSSQGAFNSLKIDSMSVSEATGSCGSVTQLLLLGSRLQNLPILCPVPTLKTLVMLLVAIKF